MPLATTTSVLALFQMFFTTTLMGVIVEQLRSPHPGRESALERGHSRGVVGLFLGFAS